MQDVVTKWNSSYYMIEHIVHQQQPLCAALLELRKTDLMPSDAEITPVEVYLEVMKPSVCSTEVIGGEQRVTLSAIRPLLHMLLSQHLAEKPSDAHLAKVVKKAVLTDMQGHYNDAEALLNKACYLNPCFKALIFLSEEQKETTVATVQTDVQDLASSQEVSEPPKKKQMEEEKNHLMSLLADALKPPTVDVAMVDAEDEAKKEIGKYTSQEAISDNPLKWWLVNRKYLL